MPVSYLVSVPLQLVPQMLPGPPRPSSTRPTPGPQPPHQPRRKSDCQSRSHRHKERLMYSVSEHNHGVQALVSSAASWVFLGGRVGGFIGRWRVENIQDGVFDIVRRLSDLICTKEVDGRKRDRKVHDGQGEVYAERVPPVALD